MAGHGRVGGRDNATSGPHCPSPAAAPHQGRGAHMLRRLAQSSFIRPRGVQAVDTVECAYPEEPVREGRSGAWLVRGRDNCAYIVKFHLDGDRAALNELVCACLARHFKLPSLKPFLVVLSAEQADQINAQRRADGLPQIVAGPHFGVKFTDSFLTAESFSEKMGRKIAAEDISNLGSVPDILGFDTLVQNNDRHSSNVGLEPDVFGNQYSYCVFDFDLALGGHRRPPQWADRLYRDLRPIMQFCLVTSAIKSKGDFAGFIDAFETSLEQGIDSALGELPDEWGPDARRDVEDLKAAMSGLDSGTLLTAIMQNRSLQVTP